MNQMRIECMSHLENESFIRTSVIAFLMPLNLSVEDCMEIKTMLAEAVVNAMIHGYDGDETGIVKVEVGYDKEKIEITVKDDGCGIDNISLALQPLYTSKQHLERSGMGMTIMQTFADDFHIESEKGKGTSVHLCKKINYEQQINE